jgi:hypothetical protein
MSNECIVAECIVWLKNGLHVCDYLAGGDTRGRCLRIVGQMTVRLHAYLWLTSDLLMRILSAIVYINLYN